MRKVRVSNGPEELGTAGRLGFLKSFIIFDSYGFPYCPQPSLSHYFTFDITFFQEAL